MGKIWIITIAIVIFLIINIFHYIGLRSYVKKEFGKKWLKVWGNKVYFWQSSILVSTAGTLLLIFLLKWTSVLNF